MTKVNHMELERKCFHLRGGSFIVQQNSGLWSLFAPTLGSIFRNNASSSEQVEEMDFNILLFLCFEAPASQRNSTKDKEPIQLTWNEDLEQQTHISQTQVQNAEDQKVLRRTSVEEQLCRPQGIYIWKKFINFCAVTLYLRQCNAEEAGNCGEKKKYFISDRHWVQFWTQTEGNYPECWMAKEPPQPHSLQVPTPAAVSCFLLPFKEGSEDMGQKVMSPASSSNNIRHNTLGLLLPLQITLTSLDPAPQDRWTCL